MNWSNTGSDARDDECLHFERLDLSHGAGSHATFGGIIVNKEGEYEVARFTDGTIQWAFANTNPGWNWVNTVTWRP